MRITEVQNREEEIRKKFGNILFGNFQNKAGLKQNEERDTKYESIVFRQVSNWFFQSGSRKEMFKTTQAVISIKRHVSHHIKTRPNSQVSKTL